jgi:hypothetical protein
MICLKKPHKKLLNIKVFKYFVLYIVAIIIPYLIFNIISQLNYLYFSCFGYFFFISNGDKVNFTRLYECGNVA